MFVEERHQEILRLLNENEKICYQWENNCFQMIHSMIEYTLIANKGDEVHVRLFRPRLF